MNRDSEKNWELKKKIEFICDNVLTNSFFLKKYRKNLLISTAIKPLYINELQCKHNHSGNQKVGPFLVINLELPD